MIGDYGVTTIATRRTPRSAPWHRGPLVSNFRVLAAPKTGGGFRHMGDANVRGVMQAPKTKPTAKASSSSSRTSGTRGKGARG
jgi:hypothetical protein